MVMLWYGTVGFSQKLIGNQQVVFAPPSQARDIVVVKLAE
jgi:hypothetical protein